MLKNKLTISIIFFASLNTYNYSMEVEESKIIDPSDQYIKKAYSQIITCVKVGDVNGLNQIMGELQANLITSNINSLLNTLDQNIGHTPLSLAQTLPDQDSKHQIIEILKKNGANDVMSDIKCMEHLEAVDAKFWNMHSELMGSIQTGLLETVKKTFNQIFKDLVIIINPTQEDKFVNNFQLLILLNESNPITGHTPLTLATECGFLDIAQLLIQVGAFPRKANKHDIKPSDIANMKTSPVKEEFLKIFNTRKTARENSVEYLRSQQHLKLVKELEEREKKKKNKKKQYGFIY